MASSGGVAGPEGVVGVDINVDMGGPGTGPPGPRNPLICGVCHDYYCEPCLLSCYHTFCARCLPRGPHIDAKLSCPICGQITQLKDGMQQPPSDLLMRQLVQFANCENPPCANCDKRDKTTMYFCITCGQALCTHCREHTHRAKMFSSHEVVHMSQCSKDTQRRCISHGEQLIMFSQTGKCMLCATCYRDTPADARLHCVDIDTAWQQASKKMERAANSICELQASVRDALLDLKSQLDELKHSLDTEKRGLNSYCHSMQDVVNKTHAALLSELHREFDGKERMVRSQLLSLGSALPVLQMHLGLCTAFTSAATKYQFLELAHPMLERLGRVAQLGHLSRPPLLSAHVKCNYKAEFGRVLQPFVAAVGQQPQGPQGGPKEHTVYEHMHLQQQQPHDSHFIQGPRPQLKGICESGRFNTHCRTFDNQLQELSSQLKTVKERLGELHRDVAVLRKANTPPLGVRYENVARDCRLLEQQLEQQQLELERLRTVFDALWEEQLCRIHLEKEVFHSQMNDILTLKSEVKQLQNVAQQLEPFVKSFAAGVSAGEISNAASDAAGNQHLQALLDHIARLQMQDQLPMQHHGHMTAPTKEYRHQRAPPPNDNAIYAKDAKEVPTRCRTPSGGSNRPDLETHIDSSGNIVVYGTKPDQPKRGVLSQLMEKARTKEDRKKSPGREDGSGGGSRDRSQSRSRASSRKSPENLTKPKTPPGHTPTSRVRSLYRSLKGSGAGAPNDACCGQIDHQQQAQQQQGEECEYQRISEASSSEVKKRVQAQQRDKPAKVYPASDSEDVFYAANEKAQRRRRRASCDSLSTTGSGSRRSSIGEVAILPATNPHSGGVDPRKTLVFLLGPTSGNNNATLARSKQRSWETFPRPKSKRSGAAAAMTTSAALSQQLKKADSFEGHEEAVRALVAHVQETKSQLRQHQLHHHRYHRKSKTN
ncbi:hypothetical protein QAD02_015367 [Eretmocerus hayati]|uniref:Uncharacterized protein n=1 Tax=Eretmocerus hayati TaxID=131215 RepID=A0ACC2P836_9HYME|nr:hypothetical protein QAD02_015367 [Eretmocerus hayati]